MASRSPRWKHIALPGLIFLCVLGIVISRNTNPDSRNLPRADSPNKIGIHFQSRGIPFNEWLSQLTLCFAPIAAHLLTGIPQEVVLERPTPSLWSRINFFNPITVIWRYMIITDRRIRSRKWCPEDMAASNVAFWTGTQWDGSEEIMVRSRASLTQCPSRSRVSVLSISTIGTLIVTIQGVQAFYELAQQMQTGVVLIQAIAGLFIPLAIGSLFRLPAALWLSDDFGYGTAVDDSKNLVLGFTRTRSKGYRQLTDDEMRPGGTGQIDYSEYDHLHPQRYIPAILFRAAVLIFIAALIFGFGLGHILSHTRKMAESFGASKLSIHVTYLLMLAVLFILCLWYFARGYATTTLIPCINSVWYTVFTIFWYCLIVVAFVINCLEMRRTSCGIYTTDLVSDKKDDALCAYFE